MRARVCVILVLCVVAISLRADSLLMRNGDQYNGKVLSVTTSNVVFQSDVLGTMNLSRSTIAAIALGTNATAVPATSLPGATNRITLRSKPKESDEFSAALRQLGSHTNLIQKVQEQFLGAASPEASAKFNEILNDLTSGKMTMADLRAQARDVANQLRALQRESGDNENGAADLYLSILDRFLGETDSTAKPTTNSAPR